MENTIIPTAQMTGMHTITAEYQAAHRWIATHTIPAGYRAARKRITTRTIPAGYRVVRRLEITAMEEITKVSKVTEIVGSIINLVIEAVIIEGMRTEAYKKTDIETISVFLYASVSYTTLP